jgi:bacterioferritin
MALADNDKESVLSILNRILEAELAGVVRYTHYSLMIYGFGRIPIVKWLRQQADEGLRHAQEADELVTHLGGHPSLGIGDLLETHKHDIGDILRESMAHEGFARSLYEELLARVTGRSVMLEEYARRLIAEEEHHAGEVDKMLRQPGTLAAFADE